MLEWIAQTWSGDLSALWTPPGEASVAGVALRFGLSVRPRLGSPASPASQDSRYRTGILRLILQRAQTPPELHFFVTIFLSPPRKRRQKNHLTKRYSVGGAKV